MKDEVHIWLLDGFDTLADTIVSESGVSISWLGGRLRPATPMKKNEFKNQNILSDKAAPILKSFSTWFQMW